MDDLGRLHEPALSAIRYGASRIECEFEDELFYSVDMWTEAIATVATAGFLIPDGGTDDHVRGFQIFGQLLLQRLRLKAERDAKATA